MTKNLLLRAALAAVLAFPAATARADVDPPARVGRLSYMEGAVSFHTADQSDWSPATINFPIVAGQTFWTEPQARLELQVGAAELRLDETTLLDVLALDDRATCFQLDQGVLNVHLSRLPSGGVQVMTPHGEVDLVAPGSYHLDAGHPDGDTPPAQLQITTLEGAAEVLGRRSRVEIQASESAIVSGDPMTVALSEGAATPFDDWALQRERREQAREAMRYVSPESTGYQDLDDNGRWSSTPDYGAVWYPTSVPADWAPYRYGHWAWIAPWGWTWIDDAPWGFAPFHYGRWVEVEGRWGWCPGEVVARPVYAPALVAFIGGAGFGITIASGAALPAVGWVPLAPHEVYRPYYRASPAYIRNVNVASVNKTVINNITKLTVANNTTVVNHYVNRQAATVVPAAAFTRAAPVQHAVVAVPHDQLAQARVAPSLAHLPPSAAARAGVAIPAAATSVVPRPNLPAGVAKAPATPAALTAPASEPAPPTAPGPKIQPRGQPGGPPHIANLPPASRKAPGQQPPAQPAQPPHAPPLTPATTQPARPSATAPSAIPAVQPPHAPPSAPAATQAAKPSGTGQPVPPSAPAAAVTHVQPPSPPHGAASPPSPPAPRGATAAMAPPRPPAPPLAPVQHPAQQTHLAPTPQGWTRAPQPPPPPQRAAQPAAQQHAPANPPPAAHGQPPAKDDKKNEHKPNQ